MERWDEDDDDDDTAAVVVVVVAVVVVDDDDDDDHLLALSTDKVTKGGGTSTDIGRCRSPIPSPFCENADACIIQTVHSKTILNNRSQSFVLAYVQHMAMGNNFV